MQERYKAIRRLSFKHNINTLQAQSLTSFKAAVTHSHNVIADRRQKRAQNDMQRMTLEVAADTCRCIIFS